MGKIRAISLKTDPNTVDATPLPPEREAALQHAIAEDPDTWTVAADSKPRRIGRPRGSNKSHVNIRLDDDILARLKADGPGWQTRANDTLRQALGL